MKRWNSLHAFCENAWEWDQERSVRDSCDEFQYFTAKFLVEHEVFVTAVVSDNTDSIQADGHIGVMWMEAEWENEDLSYHDLECMQRGIELAEEHLLKCGVPFVADYKFHGKNLYRKKQKNDAIIKKLHIAEIEEEMYKWIDEHRR